MGAAGKRLEHFLRLCCAGGFFEHLFTNDYRGIGSEDDLIATLPGGFGFLACEPDHIIARRFRGVANFLDRPRAYAEGETGEP